MADEKKNTENFEGGINPRNLLGQLNAGQMVAIGVIVAASLVFIFSIFHYATQEEKQPLFNQALDAKTQVLVEEELRTRQVDFEISKTGRILVPESRAQELRTQFEALDIAPDSRDGWKILDDTNPLKAGDSMMKLQKMRALAANIETMLMQNPKISKAKVQITPGKDSPFADESKPAKAGVLLVLKRNTNLAKEQVRGMQQQIAAAIEGASWRDVTITDQYANLLTQPATEDDNLGISQTNLDIRAKMEYDLEGKIHEIVESFLGPGKVVAKVSLDVNFDQVESVETTYGGPDAEGEPQRYAEQTKNERINRDAGLQGNVGAGANTAQGGLPQTDGTAGGSTIQRDHATNQYFIDTKKTNTRLEPFTIEKMSIALQLDYKEIEEETRQPGLIDKLTKTEPDWIETKLEALSQDEINRVRDLVIGATGFVNTRDYLSIQNFPFKPIVSKRAQAAMNTGLLLDYVSKWTPFVLQFIVFVLFVMLGISLFRRFVAPILQQAQLEEPAIAAALPSGPPKTVAELESELEQEIESAIPNAQLSKTEIMKKRLVEMTQQDPEAVAGLVRTWLLEDD
ncbi:flagellar M-ring protein FliF [Sulfidibacter corallicola]|uniref:Flagellar M-ring protein FliF n=1 Tax=Sulfidibacter corallicola TaxID=2818388 RepID=A0A8A4TPY5_SULCO|nr:flagellar basal-body MS-ring/collar protein FliF [Sulfidibacter corallicola]QTD52029.1 flagellar M-ring protein FliF [Sulfidibacter corallicola]